MIDTYRREIAPHVDRLFDEAGAINAREARVVET